MLTLRSKSEFSDGRTLCASPSASRDRSTGGGVRRKEGLKETRAAASAILDYDSFPPPKGGKRRLNESKHLKKSILTITITSKGRIILVISWQRCSHCHKRKARSSETGDTFPKESPSSGQVGIINWDLQQEGGTKMHLWPICHGDLRPASDLQAAKMGWKKNPWSWNLAGFSEI